MNMSTSGTDLSLPQQNCWCFDDRSHFTWSKIYDFKSNIDTTSFNMELNNVEILFGSHPAVDWLTPGGQLVPEDCWKQWNSHLVTSSQIAGRYSVQTVDRRSICTYLVYIGWHSSRSRQLAPVSPAEQISPNWKTSHPYIRSALSIQTSHVHDLSDKFIEGNLKCARICSKLNGENSSARKRH